MDVLRVPEQFSDLFRLWSNTSVERHAVSTSVGNVLIVRMPLEDLTQDDVAVAVSRDTLVILGCRAHASFCIQHAIPRDADLDAIQARVEEHSLVIVIPTVINPEI